MQAGARLQSRRGCTGGRGDGADQYWKSVSHFVLDSQSFPPSDAMMLLLLCWEVSGVQMCLCVNSLPPSLSIILPPSTYECGMENYILV